MSAQGLKTSIPKEVLASGLFTYLLSDILKRKKMCDCYMHRCEICNEKIPFHIGDFKFPREDFKVYCNNHVNQAPKGAVIFELVKNWDDFDEEYTAGWRCAILGPEVGELNNGDNHPNIAADFKEVIIS